MSTYSDWKTWTLLDVAVLLLQVALTQDNRTFKIVRLSAWTDAEVHVGFWVACVPALLPLIRSLSYKMGFRENPYISPRTRSLRCWVRGGTVPGRANPLHEFNETSARSAPFHVAIRTLPTIYTSPRRRRVIDQNYEERGPDINRVRRAASWLHTLQSTR